MGIPVAQSKILSYLSRLNDMVTMSNKAGQLALTKTCENLVRDLFNVIYDAQFSNTNLQIANFPAIDVHSAVKRIGIQVTSNKGTNKVVQTFKAFLSNELHLKYDRLILVILANKNYNKIALTKNCEDSQASSRTNFDFDVERDIIDLAGLTNLIINSLSPNQILEIADLLEKYFGEYTGITDLSNYYSKLKNQFFDVVMDDQAGLRLNQVYVEPFFYIETLSGQLGHRELRFAKDYHLELEKDISIHELLMSRFDGNTEYNKFFISAESKVIFVLGYPGQGKTSLCNKLLFDLLTRPQKKHVFYIKLRNISDTRSLINNPFKILFEELETELGSSFTKAMFKDSVTILDGLDELYMKDNLNADDIEAFCKAVIHEAEKFGTWDVLITTRHGYVDFKKLARECYIALLLKPLSTKQQLQYLRNYRAFHPESWLDVKRLIEINHPETGDYLAELVNQPLLLYIIASLDEPVGDTDGRTTIYNKLFDQIIDRKYSKDGQIENLKLLTKADLRHMLQEIAYLIFKSGKGYINTADILQSEALEDYIIKIGNNHLNDSLKGILIAFYFKECIDPVTHHQAGIEFFHKSLQEYLSAERIIEHAFKFLLNKDLDSKYIVRRPEELLLYLNEVFGDKPLTQEIWGFMDDLILWKDGELKQELAERLYLHIDYLFSKDFIGVVNIGDKDPVLKGISTFSSYWRLLKAVSGEKDHMKDKTWSVKYIAYHQSAMALRWGFDYAKLIDFQTISNVKIDMLHIDNEWLKETHFKDCSLAGVMITESDVINTSFNNCQIDELYIQGDWISNLSFSNGHINKLNLSTSILEKVKFVETAINVSLEIVPVTKGTLSFYKCVFSQSAYNTLDKRIKKLASFQECVIRESILDKAKIAIIYSDTPIEDRI